MTEPESVGQILAGLTIAPRRAALLIVDVQERLAAAMSGEARERVDRNVCVLIEAARRFAIPVVVSEQYPRGLGPTSAPVEAGLATLDGVERFEKLEFSACQAAAFPPLWARLGRDTWIVTGMETHVCVQRTVRDLRGRGAHVHVVADAVASRTETNRQIGLGLMARAGATITSTETVVFELLGKAGGDDFKALSKLIK
ncbi:MAG: isochorismatase family protein [Kofleriaceae bacterium]|nr:isochorismatase family protein [Myxococcales bacterium]MCB9562403.1 isochorismatase family protein [Kofleriaceae bacterium]